MKNFFVGCKAVIMQDDKLLLLKSAEKENFWDVPGGRIDDNESIHEALIRELNEELPSHKNPKVGELIHAFRIPGSIKGDIGLVLLFYKVEVDFPDGIELSDEHTEHRWLGLSEAKEISSNGVVSMLEKL